MDRALLVLLIAPLVPFALDQFSANESAGRGFQQPSQAGGSVEPGAAPGAYAALTNVAWAVLGYHSNATMTALAAMWPLGLLLALALLGRGRSWPTLLVVACAARARASRCSRSASSSRSCSRSATSSAPCRWRCC